jgi:hypothetical protein
LPNGFFSKDLSKSIFSVRKLEIKIFSKQKRRLDVYSVMDIYYESKTGFQFWFTKISMSTEISKIWEIQKPICNYCV